MKYRSFIRPTVLAATLVLGFAALAHAALKNVEEGQSSFLAVGPAGLKIDGHGTGVTASEANGVITVTVPVNRFKTGMDLRDDHLKKAIHAEKHAAATLAVSRSLLKFPEDNKEVTGEGTGKFTLNGVTKDSKFQYKVKRTGSDYHVQGLIDIDITAFGIEKPCYLGVCVEKDVKAKVKIKLRE